MDCRCFSVDMNSQKTTYTPTVSLPRKKVSKVVSGKQYCRYLTGREQTFLQIAYYMYKLFCSEIPLRLTVFYFLITCQLLNICIEWYPFPIYYQTVIGSSGSPSSRGHHLALIWLIVRTTREESFPLRIHLQAQKKKWWNGLKWPALFASPSFLTS